MNMNRNSLVKAINLCGVLFLFTNNYSFAQTHNLDYYLSQGITNNPSLKELKLSEQLIDIQDKIIIAENKKPKINFTADYLFAPYFNNDGQMMAITSEPSINAIGYDAGVTNGGLYSALVNLSLPLFNTSMINALVAENKLQYDLSKQNKLQTEHNLVKDITDKYIALYQIQDQEEYTQTILDLLKEREKTTIALIKNSLLQQTDYKLLEIEINSLENELNQLHINYLNALNEINKACAINDTAIVKMETPKIDIMATPSDLHYLNKFHVDSLNILAHDNVFNSAYKPQVNLMTNAGLNAVEAKYIPHDFGFSVGLNLTIPIYDGHLKQLNAQQSIVQMQILQSNKDNAARLYKNNLKNANDQVEQWKKTIQLYDVQIKSYEDLLEMMKEKIYSGQISMMDYIMTVRDYVSAKKDRSQANTNLLLFINQYNYYNW